MPVQNGILVNDPSIGTCGTSLMGHLATSYETLVRRFGKPAEGDGFKTDAAWTLRFPNGQVATIYNWKDGKAYLGESDLEVEDIDQWHIGGYSRDVVGLVHDALAEVSWTTR